MAPSNGTVPTDVEQTMSESVLRLNKDFEAMIAAFATLTFLVTLWLLAVVGTTILGQSGGKILAALRGRPQQSRPMVAKVRIRYRSRMPRAVRATPRLRAAA